MKKKIETHISLLVGKFPKQIFSRNKVRKINYLLNEQAIISLASFIPCSSTELHFPKLKISWSSMQGLANEELQKCWCCCIRQNNFRDNIGKRERKEQRKKKKRNKLEKHSLVFKSLMLLIDSQEMKEKNVGKIFYHLSFLAYRWLEPMKINDK